jgi:hypothetical protein
MQIQHLGLPFYKGNSFYHLVSTSFVQSCYLLQVLAFLIDQISYVYHRATVIDNCTVTAYQIRSNERLQYTTILVINKLTRRSKLYSKSLIATR